MKPIPDCPGYYASRAGTIYSTISMKVMKPWVQRGYEFLTLVVGGRRINRPVHQLVLETYVGFAPLGTESEHKNRQRSDNRLENLRYRTRGYNSHNAGKKSQYSGFRGVGFKKDKPRTKAWFAQLKYNGKYYRSKGHFATAEEAAREYDIIAIRIYGDDAFTNKSLGLI